MNKLRKRTAEMLKELETYLNCERSCEFVELSSGTRNILYEFNENTEIDLSGYSQIYIDYKRTLESIAIFEQNSWNAKDIWNFDGPENKAYSNIVKNTTKLIHLTVKVSQNSCLIL